MNEFNDRIATQRQILQSINRRKLGKEELFGLSTKEVDRWVSANHIKSESQLEAIS
jgi:hypothetical protein